MYYLCVDIQLLFPRISIALANQLLRLVALVLSNLVLRVPDLAQLTNEVRYLFSTLCHQVVKLLVGVVLEARWRSTCFTHRCPPQILHDRAT